MAKSYNLTLQLNLQGPSNLRSVTSRIKKELSSASGNLNVQIDKRSLASIDSATKKIRVMTGVLQESRSAAIALNSSMSKLGNTFGRIQTVTAKANKNWQKVNKNLSTATTRSKKATDSSNKLTKSIAKQIKSVAGYAAVNRAIGGITTAIERSLSSFIQFERNLNRIQQITNVSSGSINNLSKTIRNLGVSFGVSSSEIAEVALIFTQTGLKAQEVEGALKAVAQASLAPTFTNMRDAAEGAIAVFRQFDIAADQLESTFDSINAVAGKFAVEFDDIVSAIQRGGGAFAVASKGIDTGAESLNKFIALFTTARATTRESAETIATGIRTITARLQRLGTQVAVEDLIGVSLSNDGQFVGVYKAIEIISQRIKELGLSTQDVKFAQLVEELGGIRQISRVIPLLTQFEVAQDALNVAQNASGSTAKAAAGAQQTLQVQLQSTLEAWNDLVGAFSNNGPLRATFGFVLNLTKGFLNFAKSFEPFLPILTAIAGIKIAKGIGGLLGGGGGGLGGLFGGGGKNKGGPDQQAVINATASQTSATTDQTQATTNQITAIQSNTNSIETLTNAITGLATAISGNQSSAGSPGLLGPDGKPLAFARGGVVPGSGNRDTVPAMLTPGEFVIRKNAVSAIGADKLQAMNKYNRGGPILEEDTIGAMILGRKGSSLPSTEGVVGQGTIITKGDILAGSKEEKVRSTVQQVVPDDKKYNLIKERADSTIRATIDKAIDTVAVNSAKILQKQLESDLSIPKLNGKNNKKNFIKSLNEGYRGNLFEQIISLIQNEGKFTDNQNPQAPFDFIGPLKDPLRDLYPAIKDISYKDAKASTKAAEKESFSRKLANEIKNQNSATGTDSGLTAETKEIYDRLKKGDSEISLSNFIKTKVSQTASGSTIKTRRQKLKQELESSGLFQLTERTNQGSFVTLKKKVQEAAKGGFIQKFMAGGYAKPPSEKQLGFLKSLVAKSGVPEGFEYPPKTSQEASALINALKNPQAAPREGQTIESVFDEYKNIFGIEHEYAKYKDVPDFFGEQKQDYIRDINSTIQRFDKFARIIRAYYGKGITKSGSEFLAFGGVGQKNQTMPLDSFVSGGSFDENLLQEFYNRGKFAFGSTLNANQTTTGRRGYIGRNFQRRALGGLIQKFAEGGSAEDTVPALLTPGEFVINKQAAARIGSADLNRLNKADKVQGFNKGGPVGFVQRFAVGGEAEASKFIQAIADLMEKSFDSIADALGQGLVNTQNENAGAKQGDIDRGFIVGTLKILKGIEKDKGRKLDPEAKKGLLGKGIFGGSKIPNLLSDSQSTKIVQAITDAILKSKTESGASADSTSTTAAPDPTGVASKTGAKLATTIPLIEQLADVMEISVVEMAETIKEKMQIDLALATDIDGGEGQKQTAKAQILETFYTNIKDAVGESESLEKAFGNLSGSIAEGVDKFDQLADILPQIIDPAKNSPSGRNEGSSGLGGKIQSFFPKFSKSFSGIASKVGGIWGAAAAKVSEIWQKGGEAVAGAITKGALALGSIVGVLENAMGETDNEALAGGFGAAKGGLAGAVTGAQFASSLGLGPVETAITAAGFAVIGALKGLSDSIQKVRLNKIMKGLTESTLKLENAFQALEQNLDGAKETVVESFGEQLKYSKQLEFISAGGTFGERQFARLNLGETAVDQSRLGGFNQAAELAAGPRGDGPETSKDIFKREFLKGVGLFNPLGDVLADYLTTNNDVVLQARDALVQGASDRIDSATKFAETQGTRASDEDLAEASSISNLYFESLKKGAEASLRDGQTLSERQIRSIRERAKELSAEEAFRKQGLAAGRAAADIEADLVNKREESLSKGREYIDREQKLLDARIAQARATKEVTIAIANQTEIYRNFIAGLSRANAELERTSVVLDEFLNFNQGATVDRSNEQVLGNLLAYSPEEVRAAASPVVGALGGTEQAVGLRENLETVRFLEEKLPAVLRRSEGDPEGARGVITELRTELEAAGITGEGANAVLQQIAEAVEEQTNTGTLIDEIDIGGIIGGLSSKAEQGQQALAEATKTYNNALQQSIDLQRKYNESLNRADDYLTKAAQVQADAAIRFNEAIGKESSLDDLTKSFRLGIQNLTSGLVDQGVLQQGLELDPTAVREGISALRTDNEDLKERNKAIRAAQANLGDSEEDQRLNQQLNDEYRANETEIQNNTNALARGKQALEEMANSTQMADAALKKFEESQRKVTAAASFAQNVFTSTAQENFKRSGEIAVAREALGGNREVLQTQFGRQAAFSGLQQFEGMLAPNEYRKLLADLLEQNFLATGQDLNAQAGPTGQTYQEIIDAMRNPEETPEAKAFREASEKQASANVELALLEMENTDRIVDELQKLNDFFIGFPSLLEDALRSVEQEKTLAGEIKDIESRLASVDTAEEVLPQEFRDKRDKNLEQLAAADETVRKREEELKALEKGVVSGSGRNRTRRKGTDLEIENARRRLQDARTVQTLERQDVDLDESSERNIRQKEKDKLESELNSKVQEKVKSEQEARSQAEEAIERNRRARQGLPSIEEEKAIREAQQRAEAERLGVGTTTNSITGEVEAEVDPFADPSTQAVSLPAVAPDNRNQGVVAQSKTEQRRADLRARGVVGPASSPDSDEDQVQRDADAVVQILGPEARRQKEEDDRILANPEQYSSLQVSEAENRAKLSRGFDNRRNQGQGSAPSSVSQAGATASTEAQARQQEQAPPPAPPTALDRVNSGIASIRQTKEETGRLNPFQAKELERLNRERRKLERLKQRETNTQVPSGASDTTTVSQGVAQTQAGQQVEQRGQQQEQTGEQVFATAVQNFGGYVERLVNFEFPTIPEVITLEANHNVNVTFQGAAALNTLEGGLRTMVVEETNRAMNELWDQSNGRFGRRPAPPQNTG